MCPRSMKDRVMNRIGELDSVNLQNFIQMISKEHRFLSSLFDSLQEAILVVSPAHTVLYHNAAAQEFLGLPENASALPVEKMLPGLNLDLLLSDSGIGSRKSMRQELELTYPEHRIVQMYALPIDREDAPYALILNDITATMERAADMAESERSKAVSILAAEVAHEIGNPLNSLYLHLQFLQRLLKNPDANLADAAQEVAEARSEVERLDSIINQFLHALRPGNPVFDTLDLKSLVLDSLNFMKQEITDRKIQLEFYWGENVPQIKGDANQLKQAFYNLARNAMQAMPTGGKLTIRCSADDNFVMLSVSDSGCGIKPENMQKIFRPFFTTKNAGTGLGLMIVERIVREHGGSLAVDSRENAGTTFTISLPRRFRLVRGLPAPDEQKRIQTKEGQAE
ncbi:MAG: PAS domain-containing protein [Lentisphaeria bacterium]|nr:PAS domain-containing protein [Lentisphaeria bacterium]MBR3688285.1 PAS domain-containing protein [Lentisphaeria bacterium]